MSLQTGGLPCGAISTRSRSASWASLSAWSVGTMPTVSPLGPTSRTSGTRIRSLMRSSVLMCPPVSYDVVGPRKPLCERKRASALTHGSPRSTIICRRRIALDRTRRPGGAAVDAGGRRPPLVGSRLRDRPAVAPIGQAQGYKAGSGLHIPCSRGRSDGAPASPAVLEPHQAPPTGQAGEVLALDHEQHRAGHVDQQRVGAVLDRGQRRGGRRDRHRPAPRGSTPCSASVLVNASSAVRPSGRCISTAAMSRGLVVGQPRFVVRHLAEHRHDRHQHAGRAEGGERRQVSRVRVRVVRRERDASAAGAVPSSPAKPGSGSRCAPGDDGRGTP